MKAIKALAYGMIMELVRKKDFYVLLIFLLVLLGMLSYQNFFEVEGIERFIRDFGYSLVMMFSIVITVTFAAKQMPSEFDSRTIYPLLAKPVSRFTVILGKFTGSVAVSLIAFALFYGVYLLFYFSGGSTGDYLLIFQAFLFGIFCLCLIAALVMFFSTFLTLSANVTLSLLIYVMLTNFSNTLRDCTLFTKGAVSLIFGTLYYLIPHFDFFDLRIRLTHAWDPLPAWVVVSVALYTAIYCSALLYFAGEIFRRKKL